MYQNEVHQTSIVSYQLIVSIGNSQIEAEPTNTQLFIKYHTIFFGRVMQYSDAENIIYFGPNEDRKLQLWQPLFCAETHTCF